MLKKRIDLQQGHVAVALEGKLYMEEAAGLREQLLKLFENGNKNFTVDLSGLESMDTTGLGVFISLYKRTKTAGGDVLMVGVTGSVKQLFSLTGMDQIFTLKDKC